MTNSIEFGYICNVIWSFITYLFTSKQISSLKGNHDRLTTIFKQENVTITEVDEYINELLQSNDIIEFQDFGAGSRKFNSNQRLVKDIAKTSGTPKKYANILANLCQSIDHCKVLELGTSLGIGTLSFALNAKYVTTVEGDLETFNFTKSKLSDNSNINFVHALFDDYLINLTDSYHIYFIDGNHTKQATTRYVNLLLKYAKTGSFFILDDINWSRGMQDAWKEIKSLPDFDLSIDIFKFGLLRVGQHPIKHYKIRY